MFKLNAENVNKALQKLFRKIDKRNFKSITSDNGSEFSRLIELESRNMKVYFAHPYSSYECGTNKNINGLIRDFAQRKEHERERKGDTKDAGNIKWKMQKNIGLPFIRRISF